jgi:hypothetical protein
MSERGMWFEIIGEIESVEIIAVSRSIRERRRLRRIYGGERWRKLKGIGRVRLTDGRIRCVELHWYEAHGVGRVEHKIKKYLPDP